MASKLGPNLRALYFVWGVFNWKQISQNGKKEPLSKDSTIETMV